MITAERLEELIKQGATIYHILFNGFDLVDLTKIKELDRNNHFEYYNDCFSQYVRANNKDLYETQEQAEWYCKMTAERTERFDPPMWEDLPNEWDFYFVQNNYTFHFGYENHGDDKQIILSKCEYSSGYESDGYELIYGKFDDATKENYIEACEIVRDLFYKGGAK